MGLNKEDASGSHLIYLVQAMVWALSVNQAHNKTSDSIVTLNNLNELTSDTFLLCTGPSGERLAIPLSNVGRLDHLPVHHIQRAGGQEVVNYRGEIMPLIRLEQVLPSVSAQTEPKVESDVLQVVVYKHRGQSVGIVVGQIIDMVQESLAIEYRSNHPCISGVAVIEGQVTNIIDVSAVVRSFENGV